MNFYVVGFAFSEDRNSVLLIKKLRPKWMKGYLNGIGGKIEDGEMIFDTMNRECMEETGLSLQWKHRGFMSGINDVSKQFECDIFYAYDNKIFDFEQRENEQLNTYNIKSINYEKTVNNLNFLIPFGIYDNHIKFMTLEYER